jgi:pimeloyl-ACP methyl ester carboxylesterase
VCRQSGGSTEHNKVVMRTVILVHGFRHGSWCWSLLPQQLAALGVPSVAVDLDGHGLQRRPPISQWGRPFQPGAYATEPSSVAEVTASPAAATLVEQSEAIGGGKPCDVVAHSMGGTIATAAAELKPSLFAHLVYVAAYAPVSGMPAGDYLATPEHEGSMALSLLAPAGIPTETLTVTAERCGTVPQRLRGLHEGQDASRSGTTTVGATPPAGRTECSACT